MSVIGNSVIWDDVLAFRAVCEELHYTRAARRLHVSQPTLTARVQRLERLVGIRLLDRTSRSVRMTPAGETLYRWSADVQASWDEVRRQLDHLGSSNGVAEPERWTVGTSRVSTGDLLPLLADTRPRLDLSYRTYPRIGDLIDALRARSIDVAVYGGRPGEAGPNPGDLVVEETPARPMWVSFPAAHPAAADPVVDLAAFADRDWISADPEQEAALVGLCAAAGFAPRLRHHVQDDQLALRLVALHGAVALGPPSSDDVPGVARRPFRHAPTVGITVATLTDGPAELRGRVLRACSTQVARPTTAVGVPVPRPAS